MYVHCYRSGEIELSRKADLAGAICIAKAPSRVLRERVAVNARHAYDGKTLLVPGLPEAETDADALAAVSNFKTRLKRYPDGAIQ